MYKCKIAIGASSSFVLPVSEQIVAFRKAGFEGFFTEWSEGENIGEYKRIADSVGMEYQSIHAPFRNAAIMWEQSADADMAVAELIACLEDCGRYGVPIMVVHAFKGFKEHCPNNIGVENFRKVVQRASALGIKIAFENTEGEEYLDCLMSAFASYENVGFCWDTGHEMCYNHSKDMLAKYGDRLIATHINDNLGISKYDGEIYWTDDLHLLPFDGVADWQNVTERISRCGYDGILTFELIRLSKRERHENDKYMKMPLDEYLAEAYARACRVATLKLKADKLR